MAEEHCKHEYSLTFYVHAQFCKALKFKDLKITHKNLCTLASEFHCKFYFGHFTIYKNVNYNYNNTNMDVQRHTHAHLQLYAYSISSIMVYMI